MTAPERGDIVWLDFHPQAGREQDGRRPALVLSPRKYHQQTSYLVVCPITRRRKDYLYEVPLPEGLPVSGVVLADQVRSLDRHARRVEKACRAPEELVEEVLYHLGRLLGMHHVFDEE